MKKILLMFGIILFLFGCNKNNTITTTTNTISSTTSKTFISPNIEILFNNNSYNQRIMADHVTISDESYGMIQFAYDFYDYLLKNNPVRCFFYEDNILTIKSNVVIDKVYDIKLYKISLEDGIYVQEKMETYNCNISDKIILINLNKEENIVGYYIQVELIYHKTETAGERYIVGSLILS